jgi:signal transduction histidine kinase
VAAQFGDVADGSAGGQLVVAVPVPDQGRVAAVVRAATSRTAAYRRIALTWTGMVGLAGFAVAVTWLLARRQVVTLAGPLERLAESTRRLGDGDFTVRTEPAGIAEIDSVGTAMNHTADRLGQLIARERSFSADASHQLRTPLTGLRLKLEAARTAEGPAARAAVAAAIESVDRLERTISDLLALARDKPGEGDPLEVTALFTELRTEWHGVLAARGRPLTVSVDPDLPPTRASRAAIRQIVGVLLDNAAQHGTGAVALRARDAGSALALDVQDDGPGPVLDDEQIFARRSPEAGGFGIGLALARSLAEAEGGRLVHGDSSGSTFTLLLPATPVG